MKVRMSRVINISGMQESQRNVMIVSITITTTAVEAVVATKSTEMD